MEFSPPNAWDILLYYGGVIVVGIILFVVAGRKRSGMRLRLRSRPRPPPVGGRPAGGRPEIGSNKPSQPDKFSRIQPSGERPLNVVFNYNGHSWDAYEVLGLPAGSAPDRVELAYLEAMKKVDASSKAFMQAAYDAIRIEWRNFRSAN